MNSNILVVIKNFICGMIVGVANIIPGVSGGTMAVVLNIYDDLISSISNIRTQFKKSVKFLSVIVIAAGVAIVLCSKGISYLLENHYLITNFFFIGIILGSAPMIYKRATENSFKKHHLVPFVITFLIMIAMIVLPYDESSALIERNVDLLGMVKFAIMGMISAICMIIPGISGSFVLLLLGQYGSITAAISEMNTAILIPVGIGAIMGLLLGAKAINFILTRFPQATYFSILGFVIGSVPVIVDKIISSGNMTFDVSFVIGVVFIVVGFAVAMFFDSPIMAKIVNNKSKI